MLSALDEKEHQECDDRSSVAQITRGQSAQLREVLNDIGKGSLIGSVRWSGGESLTTARSSREVSVERTLERTEAGRKKSKGQA